MINVKLHVIKVSKRQRNNDNNSVCTEESWIIMGSSKYAGIKVSWNGIPKIKVNNSTVS